MTNDAEQVPGSSAAQGSHVGRWILTGIIVIVSISQLFVALWLIPRFAAIYRDMYPGKPIGSMTALVLQDRWILVALACLCPTTALVLARRYRSDWLLVAVLGFIAAQLFVTIITLFLPLIVTIQARDSSH